MASLVDEASEEEPPLLALLLRLQREPDGLVAAEPVVDDDDAEATGAPSRSPEEHRSLALAALDGATRDARRAAASSLARDALARVADAYAGDDAGGVAAARAHGAWLARVRPRALAFPASFPAAAASGALDVRAGGDRAALLFDSSRWHPWAYDRFTNEACAAEFERYVAYHFEVACGHLDALGEPRALDVLVRVADRPMLLRPCALFCVKRLVDVVFQYPRRLRAVYLLGAPPLFSAAWRIIDPWLDDATRGVVRFVADADAGATVAAVLGPTARGFAAEGAAASSCCGSVAEAVGALGAAAGAADRRSRPPL